MDKLTLLLDGDVFAYQAAVQSQTQIVWDDDQATLQADMGEARVRLDDRIAFIREKLKGNALIIALSDIGSGYWRRQVLPSYKEHRASTLKPMLLRPLREYLQENYDCKLKPMLEGDDVLGILSTHPTLVPGRKMIVSVDKDMKTIPGTFAHIQTKGEIDVQDYSEAEADFWHMYQTLIGDTSDGYKGCPGVGPKGAEKLLNSVPRDKWWTVVVGAFQKAGLAENDALIQARVARILRSSDYDFKLKQPILWTPPTQKGNDASIKTASTTNSGADPKQSNQPRSLPARP